jgi:hypothetical protein
MTPVLGGRDLGSPVRVRTVLALRALNLGVAITDDPDPALLGVTVDDVLTGVAALTGG